MDIKKLAIASVTAAVALLVVDYLVDMVPFIGGHHPQGHPDHDSFSAGGLLGSLFHGIVLAVVLGWRGVSDAMDGAKAGATYGALVSLALSMEAMSMNAELVGSLIGSAVVLGIAGAAVAVTSGGSDG